MGQSHKNKDRPANQWTFVDKLGRFQIYKNQNNKLAEKHIVRADPKIQQNDYLTAYHQRYLPQKPIVNAYDAQFSDKKGGFCQNSSTITVFTEFIPHRLSDIQLLNHGQGMYVLSQALAGFSQLYNRLGPFQIHQDLIGFNQQGEVKVWHNPNFAENSVDNDRIILMSTLNPFDFDRKFSQNQQHDMVQDTLTAVSRYAQFHPLFLNQAQYLKKMNFTEARQAISNQIARKAYYVPNHLFLTDKNHIIEKSGVVIKNKHVYDPNKQRKGQRYPYFADQTSQGARIQQQYGYDQANYGYENYYDGTSSSQSQSESNYHYNQEGGYYNLNGQNYRVVASKQVRGDHINQQALVDEVLRNQNYNQNQYHSQIQNYPANQSYVHTRNGINNDRFYPQYDKYTDTSSQYSHNPRSAHQHQQGHIVVSDRAPHQTKTHNRTLYYDGNQQNALYNQNRSQQNVRVISINDDGRYVEQNQYNQVPYGSYAPQQQSLVHNYAPNVYNYPNSSLINQNERVYQHRKTHSVQNIPPQDYIPQTHPIHHKHKIFQDYHPSTQMRREQPRIIEQKAF